MVNATGALGGCGTQRQRSVDYLVHDGLLLEAGCSSDSCFLGNVHGNDLHCQHVCSLVPACNMITRRGPTQACVLHSFCLLAPTADGRSSLPIDIPSKVLSRYCLHDAVTMLATRCRRAPAWHRMEYRVAVEGPHLGLVLTPSVWHCRRLCEAIPGCNSFARERGGSTREVRCHLKARCIVPGSRDTLLDVGGRPNPVKALTVKRLGNRFVSHYHWPCTNESSIGGADFARPLLPGFRRSLPTFLSTGMLSLDCKAPAGTRDSDASGSEFVPDNGRGLGGRDLRCHDFRGARTHGTSEHDVTHIAWPPSYQPSRTTMIVPPQRRRAHRQQWIRLRVSLSNDRCTHVHM